MTREEQKAVEEFTEMNLTKKGIYHYNDMQDAFLIGLFKGEKMQPPLASNLDEAAEISDLEAKNLADDYTKFLAAGLTNNEPRPIGPQWMKKLALDRFKAGAEWMAGQGGEIKGWLARHRNGELCLFFNKPEYKLHIGWVDEHQHWRVIDANLFPEIKFKDSPIEVIINIRKK